MRTERLRAAGKLWRVLPLIATVAASATVAEDAVLRITAVQPTVFFKRDATARVMQVARLSLRNDGSAREVTVIATIGGESARTTTTVAGGAADIEILVPPLAEAATGTLDLQVTDGTLVAQHSEPWRYQRQWKLYLTPYCHVDVGYSNTQADVETIHKLNLDGKVDANGTPTGVLDLLAATDDFPGDSRFRFTSEGSWPVIKFLEDPTISEARKQILIQRIHEGRIEVGGFYIDHINKFLGDEALVRSTYFSAEYLARTFGINVTAAILNDVGDASSIALPLAGAGIRYFQFGANSIQYPLPSLFYLRAPGTDTRVLVWRTPNAGGYGENTDLALRPPPPSSPTEPHDPNTPVDAAQYEQAIADHLSWLQDHGLPLPKIRERYKDMDRWHYDYPYDAYLVPYYPAHAGDNGHQDLTPSRIARDWNERYAFPRLIVATQSQFYEYVESKYKQEIPEIPLDFTGYWGEQIFIASVQIDPVKESRNRQFIELMSTGEAFASFASSLSDLAAGSDPTRPPDTSAGGLRSAGASGVPAGSGPAEPTPGAGPLSPSFPYPDPATVREMYGRNLLNNDHNPIPVPISGDHCPANSSGICYQDADIPRWKDTRSQWTDETYDFATALVAGAQQAIATQIGFADDVTRIVVFNPSGWERRDVVEVRLQGSEAARAPEPLNPPTLEPSNPRTLEPSLPAALLPFRLLDDSGTEHAYQIVENSAGLAQIVFLADVPAYGYRTYALRPGEPTPAAALVADDTGSSVAIENEYYRLRVSKDAAAGQSGTIERLFDKQAGRELIDAGANVGLNQYFVLLRSQAVGGGILGDDALHEYRPGWITSHAELLENGPVRARIRVVGTYDSSLRTPALMKSLGALAYSLLGIKVKVPGSSPTTLSQDIILYQGIKRVEFVQTFDHTTEQVFENAFAYSLALPQWQEIRVELPYNVIRYGGNDWAGLQDLRTEQSGDQALAARLQGGINQYNVVFSWVGGIAPDVMFRHFLDISEPDFGVAFSARESGIVFPMQVDAAPIAAQPAPRFYHLAVGPTLIGNFLLGAPVDTTYVVHSALTSHGGPWNTTSGVEHEGSVARWGRAFTAPLQAQLLPAGSTGPLPAAQSFAAVAETNVVMPVIKRAEDGDGYVVRLLETAGEATAAHVQLPFAGPTLTWTLASTVERERCQLAAGPGNTAVVSIQPHELVTLRVRRGAAPAGILPCEAAAPTDVHHEGFGCQVAPPAPGGAGLLAVGLLLAWGICRAVRR